MKDESRKSLPRYVNVSIPSAGETDGEGNPKGRQVHVKKANFGQKLRLFEIFSGWLGHMGAAQKLFQGPAFAEGTFKFMAQGLPGAISSVRKDYPEVFSISTDLIEREVEQLELPDAITLFETVWKINRFNEDLLDLGKLTGGGTREIRDGSNGSSPSSPSERVGASGKS